MMVMMIVKFLLIWFSQGNRIWWDTCITINNINSCDTFQKIMRTGQLFKDNQTLDIRPGIIKAAWFRQIQRSVIFNDIRIRGRANMKYPSFDTLRMNTYCGISWPRRMFPLSRKSPHPECVCISVIGCLVFW